MEALKRFVGQLQPTQQCETQIRVLLCGVDVQSMCADVLQCACRAGNIEAVQTLLAHTSLSWNTTDSEGCDVGRTALLCGHRRLYAWLVGEGVRSEFVLACTGTRFANEQLEVDTNQVSNQTYLDSKLTFSVDAVVDAGCNAVMMAWETPLMAQHCHVLPIHAKNVLNVGFGLGVIDRLIQDLHPCSHTIIEAHPGALSLTADVYSQMVANGWNEKPNVKIIFGRWQDVLHQLECYDAIFFDTFGEYYADLKQFHDHVPNILDQHGVYSYFNGLCGTNQFFHDVACGISECDLHECQMQVKYIDVEMDKLDDDVWKDIRRPYWSLPIYRVPVVTFI